ncbi:pE183L [African swine fever virus]|uniref:PE183L n=1 Tax=African swine fever virus TaxID=10497 RepID=A0A894KPQ0_ASF|nr:pE183L [African swine fever virus]
MQGVFYVFMRIRASLPYIFNTRRCLCSSVLCTVCRIWLSRICRSTRGCTRSCTRSRTCGRTCSRWPACCHIWVVHIWSVCCWSIRNYSVCCRSVRVWFASCTRSSRFTGTWLWSVFYPLLFLLRIYILYIFLLNTGSSFFLSCRKYIYYNDVIIVYDHDTNANTIHMCGEEAWCTDWCQTLTILPRIYRLQKFRI